MAKKKQPEQRKARVKSSSGQIPNPAQAESTPSNCHKH